MNKGDLINGKLGNFYFGGIIMFKVTTQDWTTKLEKHTYTVKLPCGVYIETQEVWAKI